MNIIIIGSGEFKRYQTVVSEILAVLHKSQRTVAIVSSLSGTEGEWSEVQAKDLLVEILLLKGLWLRMHPSSNTHKPCCFETENAFLVFWSFRKDVHWHKLLNAASQDKKLIIVDVSEEVVLNELEACPLVHCFFKL